MHDFEKFKSCFPDVNWDKTMKILEMNKGEYSFLNPGIDMMVEQGMSRMTAIAFVSAMLDISVFFL